MGVNNSTLKVCFRAGKFVAKSNGEVCHSPNARRSRFRPTYFVSVVGLVFDHFTFRFRTLVLVLCFSRCVLSLSRLLYHRTQKINLNLSRIVRCLLNKQKTKHTSLTLVNIQSHCLCVYWSRANEWFLFTEYISSDM